MCLCVGVWEWQRARAITVTLMDCISVCMTGQLSHNGHRITGNITVLEADLGRESCEKLFSGVLKHSCTVVLLDWVLSWVTLTCLAECYIWEIPFKSMFWVLVNTFIEQQKLCRFLLPCICNNSLLIYNNKQGRVKSERQCMKSYLTGSEGDPIVVLHAFFLLPVVQPLPADADCYRSKIVIYPEIILMLWSWSKKDQN